MKGTWSRWGPTHFPLPGLQTAVFSLYPHMLALDQSGRKQALWGLFLPGIESTSLAVKVPSSNHRTARELPVLLPNTITLGVRVSIYEFGGGEGTNMQFITMTYFSKSKAFYKC